MDESGFSKGFGFIRFNNEVEQQTAMTSMNGMSGLGGKPIKVSVAVNKIKDGMNGGGGGHGNVPDHIYKQVTNNVVGKFFLLPAILKALVMVTVGYENSIHC